MHRYKRVCPAKNELQQQGISFLERKKKGGRDVPAGKGVSRQAYLRLKRFGRDTG